MARTPKFSQNRSSTEADIAFMEELVNLVRQDGHTLSLSARKKLIDSIERLRSMTDSERRLPPLVENGHIT